MPDKPHWVTIDLTNPPGDWNPRRPDWKDIILNQDFSKVDKDYSQDPPAPLKRSFKPRSTHRSASSRSSKQ